MIKNNMYLPCWHQKKRLQIIYKKTKVTIVLQARYGKPEQMIMWS
jgi:hypothetical protein